jgi:cytochrome P450
MTVDANQRRLVRPVGRRAQRSPTSDVQRLRDDAPMHDNETHDFYPLSRFDDVNRALVHHQIFSFAKRVELDSEVRQRLS